MAGRTFVIFGLMTWLIACSEADQSVGTLCLVRNNASTQKEDCWDFALDELPTVPNPEQVVFLTISEVDEATLDPVLFEPFVNLEKLVIEKNNFEYLTGPFPKLERLTSLTFFGNALRSMYWKSDAVSRENRELHGSIPEKKVLKLLTAEAHEALQSDDNAEILAQLLTDGENFTLDPELVELLQKMAEKWGQRAQFEQRKELKNALVNLKQLKYLNISRNNITELGSDMKSLLIDLREIDMSGNPWNCTADLVWVTAWNETAKKANETICGPFDAVLSGTNIFRALNLIKQLDLECPNRCVCKLDRVPKLDLVAPAAIVNCSGIGLTRLPLELPTGMILTLDMKNNVVSDLRPLASSPYYRRLNRLFLDNNNISSLSGLEGSTWLSNLNALSLQGNRLSYIPTYALEDALKYQSGAEIWFGNNPWTCDCSTVPDLQNFLAKHKENIKDVGAMRCAALGDDANAYRKVTEVALESVCLEESNGAIELMNVINVGLALLTLLLVGNLCYDYYQFRKTGKIPWIVTKMP